MLQNIDETGLPFLVTLNPDNAPDHTLLKWSTGHPVPSVAATKASLELDHIQGKRRIWFGGAYQGKSFACKEERTLVQIQCLLLLSDEFLYILYYLCYPDSLMIQNMISLDVHFTCSLQVKCVS